MRCEDKDRKLAGGRCLNALYLRPVATAFASPTTPVLPDGLITIPWLERQPGPYGPGSQFGAVLRTAGTPQPD